MIPGGGALTLVLNFDIEYFRKSSDGKFGESFSGYSTTGSSPRYFEAFVFARGILKDRGFHFCWQFLSVTICNISTNSKIIGTIRSINHCAKLGYWICNKYFLKWVALKRVALERMFAMFAWESEVWIKKKKWFFVVNKIVFFVLPLN